MSYEAQEIVEQLHAARDAKGLSQRELSTLAGVPQAQISRIEAGNVDLRLSSLAALANALDLELALVPRKAMPAVHSLSRETLRTNLKSTVAVQKEMQQILEKMRHLRINAPNLKGLEALQKNLADLNRFRTQISEPDALKRINKLLSNIKKPEQELEAISKSQNAIKTLRNALVHGAITDDTERSPRPAYTLDNEDDG